MSMQPRNIEEAVADKHRTPRFICGFIAAALLSLVFAAGLGATSAYALPDWAQSAIDDPEMTHLYYEEQIVPATEDNYFMIYQVREMSSDSTIVVAYAMQGVIDETQLDKLTCLEYTIDKNEVVSSKPVDDPEAAIERVKNAETSPSGETTIALVCTDEDSAAVEVEEEPVVEEPYVVTYEPVAATVPDLTPPYNWSSYVNYFGEVPEDGSLLEWAPRFYVAHIGGYYGNAMLGIQPGEVVTVNGHSATIQGSVVLPAGIAYEDVLDVIGADATIFQTCMPDGSGYLYVYGR